MLAGRVYMSSTFLYLSNASRKIGEAIIRFISRQDPQLLVTVLAGLLLTLISTVFTVASYYKDSGNPRNVLAGRGIPWNEERFFEAIRVGDSQTVDLFLEGGMNPHLQADDRQLPIHLSKNRNNPAEILEILTKHGLEIDYPYKNSRTTGPQENRLLFWATFSENDKLVEVLLKKGANTNFETEIRGAGAPFKQSLLKVAQEKTLATNATEESKHILKTLLEAGAKLSDVESQRESVLSQEEIEHRLNLCSKEMATTSMAEWYEKASKFNRFSSSESVRDAVLFDLNGALLMGTVSDSNAKNVLDKAIEKGCKTRGLR